MPATKKRRAAVSVSSVEKKVAKVNEHMQMLLVVFAAAMMMFAFVLVKVYAQ